MLKKQSKSKNHHVITATNFEAIIRMNPCDAMVFCEITVLPENPKAAIEALRSFKKYFYEQYGAKSLIQAKHHKAALAEAFSEETIRAITFTRLPELDFSQLSKKPHVAKHLAKFETGEYTLLSSSADYEGKHEKIFEFKKQNATFVTNEKIEQNIYSVEAEKDKVTNELGRHFAVEKGGDIVATVMITVHENMAYLADLIVHKEYRSENAEDETRGLAQTIITKAFEQLSNEFPAVDVVWFIPGGDGERPVGEHLCGTIFKTQQMDADAQRERGLLVRFGAPGPELRFAAGRISDEEYQRSLAPPAFPAGLTG